MPDQEPLHTTDTSDQFTAGPMPVVTPAGERSGMLPGVAGIGMFLLLVTMLNAFGAVTGAFGPGRARYVILLLCTLLMVGVFGLLRLRRWGWALAIAGCLTMSLGDIYAFSHTHVVFFMIRGLLEIVFFLYLSRTEVRERMH